MAKVHKNILDERCPECCFPTIERIKSFKGEKLAVSACMNPACENFYDWEVPKKARNKFGNVTDENLFDESSDWAEEEASKMREEFFSRAPIKIEMNVTERDIEKYLDQKNLCVTTRDGYKSILRGFVVWLKKRESLSGEEDGKS